MRSWGAPVYKDPFPISVAVGLRTSDMASDKENIYTPHTAYDTAFLILASRYWRLKFARTPRQIV